MSIERNAFFDLGHALAQTIKGDEFFLYILPEIGVPLQEFKALFGDMNHGCTSK